MELQLATGSSPSSPSTFHGFTSLPPELRAQIWIAALRDLATPGVQFLSSDHTTSVVDPAVFVPSPQTPQTSPASPIHNPKSTYTHDYGLWTACKESRPIIQYHYRSEHWREVLRYTSVAYHGKSYPSLWRRPSRVLTGASTLDNLTTGFAILPHHDLLIYQPRRPDDLPSSCAAGRFLASSPWTMHPLGAANAALDLNTTRASRTLLTPQNPLFAFLPLLLLHVDKIWLIDPDITRGEGHPHPDTPPEDPPRAVFRGRGVRYTEVRPGDTSWRHGPQNVFPSYCGEVNPARSARSTPGALRLVAALERQVRATHDPTTCWRNISVAALAGMVSAAPGSELPGDCIACRVDYEELVRGRAVPDHIGLLACETVDE